MATKFIPRAIFPEYRVSLSDFKGHQSKALTRMGQLAPQIDLVFELRDARAPVSTRNVLIERAFRATEKIILYTKTDLSSIPEATIRKWHPHEKCMFVDCRDGKSANKILDEAKKTFYDMYPRPPLGLRMMIAGMPNVGKSTLVNTLRNVGLTTGRNSKVAKSGNQPGVTRKTSEIIRVSRQPEILLYDTPGVLLPQVNDIKTMLSLSIVGSVSESKVDPVIVADYLLYVLNLQDPTGKWNTKYMDHPTNDVYEFLYNVGKKTKKIKKNKAGELVNDDVGSAIHFIRELKRGLLGKYVYDVEAIKSIALNEDEIRVKFKEERDRVDSMDSVVNRPMNPDAPKSYHQRQSDNTNSIFKKLKEL